MAREASRKRTTGRLRRAGEGGSLALGLALLGAAGSLLLCAPAREPALGPQRAHAALPGPGGAAAPVAVHGHTDPRDLAPAAARHESPSRRPQGDAPGNESTPEAALVRVHGHVQQGGLPAAGWDLAFRRVDQRGLAGEEADWDLTGEHGRYEVRLPPAAYLITSEEAGSQPIRIVVPAGRDELALDLVLPADPAR